MINTRNLDVLSVSNATLISTLLNSCEASQTFIEAKLFRRDHYSQVEVIDQLEKHRYLIKEQVAEKQLYRVSLTAMVQLAECQAAQNIIAMAELMWRAFREHYVKSLDHSLTLRTIADSIGLSIVLVTRVHTYMREWWHTPSCFTPADSMDPAVTVREEVLRYMKFSDCVQQMRELQAEQIQSPNHGFVGWSQLDIEPKAPPVSGLALTRKPSWLGKLPPHAQALMREIYSAMDAGLLALPAMGIRAVIDVVSDGILGVAYQSFDQKLDALSSQGHLSPDQHGVLQAVVQVGHAAAHRSHVPDRDAVQLMLDTLEHVLYTAYELDGASQILSAKTPPRPPRVKLPKSS